MTWVPFSLKSSKKKWLQSSSPVNCRLKIKGRWFLSIWCLLVVQRTLSQYLLGNYPGFQVPPAVHPLRKYCSYFPFLSMWSSVTFSPENSFLVHTEDLRLHSFRIFFCMRKVSRTRKRKLRKIPPESYCVPRVPNPSSGIRSGCYSEVWCIQSYKLAADTLESHVINPETRWGCCGEPLWGWITLLGPP